MYLGMPFRQAAEIGVRLDWHKSSDMVQMIPHKQFIEVVYEHCRLTFLVWMYLSFNEFCRTRILCKIIFYR